MEALILAAEELQALHPTQPALPAGFSEALEETDGLTYADGAQTQLISGMDTVFVNDSQWNNKNQHHAAVKEPGVFQSKEFTVLFDVKPVTPSANTEITTQRTALTIGTSANSLHVLTWDGKLGNGGHSNGICTNGVALTGFVQNDWNSVAFVYHEDGGNSAVEEYINGKLAGNVEDLGFKLSTMNGLTATLARSIGTNYMMTGMFDNIVVGTTALDAATAKAETAYRAYRKDNLPAVNTAELEALIETIEAEVADSLAAGVIYADEPLEAWRYTVSGATVKADTLDDLYTVLEEAKALIAEEEPTQDAVTACLNKLQTGYDSLRTLPEPYTSIPGTTGEQILADSGLPMQAHGDSAMALDEGEVNYDLDGDGEITGGKTVYLWYGEDKINDTHPVDGVRCYVSTDLYNWSDRALFCQFQRKSAPDLRGRVKIYTTRGRI